MIQKLKILNNKLNLTGKIHKNYQIKILGKKKQVKSQHNQEVIKLLMKNKIKIIKNWLANNLKQITLLTIH